MMATKPVVLVLGLSALVFATLLPPEAYPVGKMGVILCSTFTFLIALSERKIPNRYLISGIFVLLLLLAHSLFVSADHHRSLDFLTMLWAYYCLLGFMIYAGHETDKYAAGVMVLLTTVVSVYGIYQYFWGFDEMRAYVVYSVSGQAEKASALDIIARRRVFSTLVLPGTLWGFLLTAMPIHRLLWKQHRILDAAIALSIALLLVTGFLTQSFGFLLGLLLLAGVYLFERRIVGRKALVVLLILLVAVSFFYFQRRGAISASNPFALRAMNWLSAWSIFAVHPWGTGLNTFGVMYPQYMLPRANETQYAHNTPLQLMSELGYPAVLAGIALILFAAKFRIHFRETRNACLLLALLMWLLHNLIDINIYFPSIGVLGVVLAGLLLARPQAHFMAPRKVIAANVLITVFVLVFSGLNLVSSELEHRAQVEYDNGKPLVALDTLEAAQKLSPWNSVVFEDSGEILLDLHHKSQNAEYLDRATAAFKRAIELSPQRADPHVWFSLALAASGKLDEALAEIRTARLLFPSSERIYAIIRLMENRKGF
ncbi:MAG: tetratricopeptide repeat protein [Acidobacteria bacterium]|nr:tetratricopeptide repeat protein [Acidobacteriota bacterium]